MRSPRCLCLALVLAFASADAALAEWQVWTLGQTRRVLREDPPEAGKDVKISAAQNEWESFQVFMRSDAPVGGVRLEPGDLRGPNGAVLKAADARLYRQHQLHLTEPTSRNDAFKPGWYPDPLIPFVHPLSGKPLQEARFTAAPFDLPGDQTHGFWIDLYVPPKTQPGEYRGTYRMTAEGGKAVEIPVLLTVWNFELSATPALATSFGSPAERLRAYYRKRSQDGKEPEPKDWDAVEKQCAQMLSEHRVNATFPERLLPQAQADGSFRIPAEQVQSLREFIDRYHVNAVPVPHPSSAVKNPERDRAKLHAWLAAFDRAAAELDRPQATFYTYLKDEPNDEEAYRYVQQWGRAIREAKSVVKVLVVEQTLTQNPAWGDLYGAVDIWCPLFSLHDPKTAAERRAQGETIWTYTALCQRDKTPWWHIDYPLLHYRVPSWMAWREGMRGLLYWGGMSYWDQVDDPWTDPKTYRPGRNPKGPLFNGEGTIVYPAGAVGYDGIAPSLRLKALRDSIEDYEYLAILDRLGRASDAKRIVQELTPSFYQWNADPMACETARAKLAELILSTRPKGE